MNTVDWNSIKFRASSWGNLLAESRDKTTPVGKTCAAELIKIYNQVKYGRKKDITTKQMDKGKLCEEDGITMVSRVEKKLYLKNQDQLENEWFTGHPDIFSGESIATAKEVSDIKCSWEMDTFTPKLLEPLDKGYEAQLNVYYDLTGAESGSLFYCLVSAPMQILEQEKKSLLWRMNVATELNPEYIEAVEELERLMVFEDIDIRERIIKLPVPRNEELIKKMKGKVPVFREWLCDFEKKHMALYPH
jgi:hypothetical protein